MDKRVEELIRQKRIHGLSEEVSQEEIFLLNDNMPIQKIIGFIKFDDIVINVNRDVLIPRYETEEVVEKALKYIQPGNRVLDLCSGSGYIGLTIKSKVDCEVVLSDISEEAYLQAKENADLNKLDVEVIQGDLFENVEGEFDVIVCNPPYIPSSTDLDYSVIQHEPSEALFAGEDGNDIYRRVLNKVYKFIKPGGWLIFEISPENKKFLYYENDFTIFKDINGKERIAIKQF